jgi:hypothetical protein
MNYWWKYVLCIALSVVLSSIGAVWYTQPKIETTPFWHPFKLNSNISLEALVRNGYRCFSSPCGQPQFIKTIGDTMVQYDVSSIDCKTYEGHFDITALDLENQEIVLDTNKVNGLSSADVNIIPQTDSALHFNTMDIWKELHTYNPYYPYEYEQIKDCYQGIKWRIFQISMKSIDSLWVENYIVSKGGYIVSDFQNWNAVDGGSFLVYYNETDLYFRCSISKDEYYTWDNEKNWNFTIIRTIPHLDQQRQKLESIREQKRFKYYD